MTTLFYLDAIESEEPQGFAGIVLNLMRDENWHGIFSEASTSPLGFYGTAAAYLKNKKETEGLRADVTFSAYMSCGGIYDEQIDILTGKIDFTTYREDQGELCIVYVAVEQTGCGMTLRNRYDQKVNMDSDIAFDGMTGLNPYAGLNYSLELPPHNLRAAIDGSVGSDGHTIIGDYNQGNGSTLFVRPTYSVQRSANIQTSQLDSISDWETNGLTSLDFPITPQLLYEDVITCFSGDFEYDIRKKGTYDFTLNGNLVWIKVKLITWDGTGNIFTDHTVIDSFTVAENLSGLPESGTFDGSITGTTVLTEGIGLYAIVEFATLSTPGDPLDFEITFDSDTYFTLNAVKSCPATEAEVFFINEALSRATEAITNNCLQVKSDYYGRADSQPYASDADGCGGLRVVTNGLKIRRAERNDYFISLKDLFDGLKPIDNIGMGLEENPNIPNSQWLRIEQVDYFYRDEEILSLPYVPKVEFELQENKYFSLIRSGFEKWEVEDINGLQEFNSTREYRTGLTAVNNTIDILSKFVAGSIPLEITRQQSFADTGAADSKFDNDTFIIVLDRINYGFQVEQGNIDNPANIFSPDTVYNWRIRPYYNLMRWFKSIANSYPNIDDTINKLYFSSGTGNYAAEGELIQGLYDPACKLENGVKAENRNLSKLDFADVAEATPLWKPETVSFTYDLSVKDYQQLKANPYGYISFQPGKGSFLKGYIQSIKYKLNEGTADFVLKIKWD
jgi:hypothetical protein